MLQIIKHLPVNWVDGMKISKEHFETMDRAITDLMRDALNLHITDYNFGLLNPGPNHSDACSVEVNSERVDVFYCRAITRAGARIEILNEDFDNLKMSMQQLMSHKQLPTSSNWFVILKINPFKRQATGQPDPEESPLRQPFVVPEYSLEIISGDQLNNPAFAAFAIPIAKIEGGSTGLQRAINYIPPCTSIDSSRELMEIYRQYEGNIKSIDQKVFGIIQKIQHKRKRKDINILSDDIYLLSLKIMEYFSETYDRYRMVYSHQPPIFMIEYFVKLARIIKTSLRLMQEKDVLLEYFRQYIEHFQAATFSEILDEMTNLQYNHFDIRICLDKTDRFIGMLDELYSSLMELDYRVLARHDFRIIRDVTYSDTPETRTPPTSTRTGSPKIKIEKKGQKDTGDDPTNPWGLK